MPTSILQKGEKQAKKHTLATSEPFDTLESIASKNNVKTGWQGLATYLFGTSQTDELNRAFRETIGVAKVDLVSAQKTQLKPMEGGKTEVPLPEDWTKTCDGMQRYRLTVKRNLAPTAISITNLDKWFIPGLETNDIRFTVEGDPEYADKIDFVVYGSNYCECTDLNNGLGKYNKLENEPIFREEGMRAPERGENQVLNVTGAEGKNAWKGQANAAKGMFAFKDKDEKERFINVAFSPYTVLLRYRKTDDDKKALLLLEPFWPQWEEQKQEPAVTADFSASPATFQWTNDKDQDSGVLEITDAIQQRVYLSVLKKDLLEKGQKNTTWDKAYREDATNGKFEQTYIDDAAETAPLKKLLFKSTPYKGKITTTTYKLKTDSAKIKWEIKDTTKLERGLLIITDKNDAIVFQKALGKDLVGQKKSEFAWDGKYLPGVRNSLAKKDDPKDKIYEAIPQDMPYCVQIQVHTGEGKTEGLALAARHTEVRLYVHSENRRPDEPGFDPLNSRPSLLFGVGSVVPGNPPQLGQRTNWFRYKLAEYGFHPGPVTDKAAANDSYKIALKEFKRSVPADGTAAAGSFKRLKLDGGEDEQENLAAETAIKTLRAGDRRKWFADLSKVIANSDEPNFPVPSEATNPDGIKADLDKVNDVLRKPEEELVVWVDERQYNTAGLGASGVAMDENDNNFYDGEPNGSNLDKATAKALGLNNYRGTMDNGDGKVTLDAAAVPRPWLPLQADPVLLSRNEDIFGNTRGSQTGLNLTSLQDKRRDAMRLRVGPLRVDWTFEDLPADLSVIDPASYNKAFSRSRKYVAWALRDKQGTHLRKDTKRNAIYPNCPVPFGGIRPDNLATYFKEAYGLDDLSLAPWKTVAVTDTESVATVIHERLLASQKKDTDLFESRLGMAGVYFRPSTIAGDGYRLRVEFRFDKFGDYDFPNLATLKARYPVTPQAHTAGLRVWRRSSMRGYACWAPAGTGHWPGLVNGFREHYRPSHVYFVHEGQNQPRTFDITNVFTDDRYKKIVSNNIKKFAKADSAALAKYWRRATAQDTARMTRDANTIWPWSQRDDLGWEWPSKKCTSAEWNQWMNDFVHQQTWRSFREGLLIAILKVVEQQGVMRGHLFVEFRSSPDADYEAYTCTNNCLGANKYYWFIRKSASAAGQKAGTTCPTCGGAHTLVYFGQIARGNRSLPWAAVGSPLGATWLFTTSDADTWAHEVGHHRHFIHAASAPGSQQNPGGGAGPTLELHDHEANTTQNWGNLQTTQGNDNGTKASERDWDRNCIMSYAASNYGATVRGRDTFCGKCVLRQSGWKVEALGYPGGEIQEP